MSDGRGGIAGSLPRPHLRFSCVILTAIYAWDSHTTIIHGKAKDHLRNRKRRKNPGGEGGGPASQTGGPKAGGDPRSRGDRVGAGGVHPRFEAQPVASSVAKNVVLRGEALWWTKAKQMLENEELRRELDMSTLLILGGAGIHEKRGNDDGRGDDERRRYLRGEGPHVGLRDPATPVT